MAGKVHLKYDNEKKKAAVTVSDLSCRLLLYTRVYCQTAWRHRNQGSIDFVLI